MSYLCNVFSYTMNSDEGTTNLVVDVELPGIDPNNVKLGFYSNKVQLNNRTIAMVTDRFDLKRAKAELKYGLLKITVPENVEGKGEIPITVT